jgi:hypothetical protein
VFAVVMGADPSTVAATREALSAAAFATAAAAVGGARGNGSAGAAAAGGGAPRGAWVSELPVPGPVLGGALGLAPTSSYMMLLLR